MKALTLIRPWPWAILQLGKRVENRSRSFFGGRRMKQRASGVWELKEPFPFAIHAGDKLDKAMLTELRLKYPDKFHLGRDTAGGVVGVALVTGQLDLAMMQATDPIARQKAAQHADWLFGPYGLELDGVLSLPRPVPCKGFLGMWELPPLVVAKLREQLRELGAPEVFTRA